MLERLQFENQSGGGDAEVRPVDLYNGGAAYVRCDYLVDRADFTAREHSCHPIGTGSKVVDLIAEKLGISQPTLSEHMRVLCHAGLLNSKKIKQWTFYKRNEARIKAIKRSIAEGL